MTVAFDISRLAARARFDTPTGIDRFELNYAKWAIGRFETDLRFVANGPFGPRAVQYERGRTLVDETDEKWRSSYNSAAQAAGLRRLAHQIDAGTRSILDDMPNSRPEPAEAKKLQHMLASMAALLWTPSTIPQASLFVHVSHSGIHKQSNYDWLSQRGCLPLFYLHDLIPLLRPEFCRAGEADRHKARIQTMMRLHRLILCNSQTTARTLDELAAGEGLPQPFTAVLPPGIEDTFLHFDHASSLRTKRPYFVCLGTIEPRKNHALLLALWRHLVERDGARAPRLVIAGRRGWDNAHIFSVLNDPAAYQGTVIEAPGLSDSSLAQLVGGASALLAPSHIEGYGMPVAEALAIGTPVIASNIRAHREVSRGRAVLLDNLDGTGWLSAIDAHAKWPRRLDCCEQRRWTWTSHFDALDRLLASAIPERLTKREAAIKRSPAVSFAMRGS